MYSSSTAMRVLLLTLGATALTSLVVSNAYLKKEQFYPTVVYLLNSNRSLCVLYLQGFVTLYLLCSLLKKMFFGTLRDAEVEHLIESSWFAVLETFILLAAFHQELNITFVSMISVLFVMKSFHWLAGDRVDYMERSPLISWLFHLRAVTLLLLLGTLDYLCMRSAWRSIATKGLSVEIVFGLEYAIMFLNLINTLLRYILHTIDLQSEDPWENKTIYMRIVDIILGFFKLIIYVSYMSFMLYVLFIPLHIARRIYITAKNFQKSIADVISSHKAIRNLNTLYPDATADELNTANNVCIICREEMADRCKKLPCNHIFHMACLRSWFQRQQTCPTCRMDVLSESAVSRMNQAQQRRANINQQQPPPQPEGQGGLPPPNLGFPMMWPGMVPPPPMQQNQPPQPAPAAAAAGPQQQPREEQDGGDNAPATEGVAPVDGQPANNGQSANGPGPGQGANMLPPFPPFMVPPPFGLMPPPFGAVPSFGPVPPFGGMPSGDVMAGLTDEQLHSLEGMERANVEARVQLLRNVQRLLDSAVTQLNQYSAVMATLGPSAGPGFPGYPPPPDHTAGPTLYTSQATPTQSRQKPPDTQTQTSFTGSSSKLSELKPTFSFSSGNLESDTEENSIPDPGTESRQGLKSVDKLTESDVSEEVKSKPLVPKLEPLEQVDDSLSQEMADIRQRRLQRFNSVPQSGSVVAVEDRAGTKDSDVDNVTEID